MRKINNLIDIHIGPIIKQKLAQSSMTIQEFADKINCERTTIYDIFKRKSIDTEKLIRISQALDFDFIEEIYYEKDTLEEKPPTVFIAVPVDKETLQKLNLSEQFIKLIEKA